MSRITFFGWLPSRQRQLLTSRREDRRRRPSAARYVPSLEVLEGRTLPSTITVMNNLDSGSGSLRAAIGASSSGDTINFYTGLIGQTIKLISGSLNINHNLTIIGPGADNLTISAGYISRVIDISGGGVRVCFSFPGYHRQWGFQFFRRWRRHHEFGNARAW